MHSRFGLYMIFETDIRSFGRGNDFLTTYRIFSKPASEWPWPWLDPDHGMFINGFYLVWITDQNLQLGLGGGCPRAMYSIVLMDGVCGYRLLRAVHTLKRAWFRKLAIRRTQRALSPAKRVSHKWKDFVDNVTCVLGGFLYGRTPAIDLTSQAGSTSTEHSN